jgi:hypothetical protein
MNAASPADGPSERVLRIGYAVAGLGIGGAWAYGWELPVWEHALRLLALVLIVPPIIHFVRRRRAKPRAAHPPLRHLVCAKVLLVVAAIGLNELLGLWTAQSAFATAAALAVVVAFGGPPWHRKLVRRNASRTTSSAGAA